MIDELKKKFVWMENMNVKGFKYKGLMVPLNSNCERNEIPKNSRIEIIFQ